MNPKFERTLRRPHGGDSGPIWLGHTPTGDDLEGMPLDWFHQAVDQLDRETVPKSYWSKVIARRQAQAWEVR